MKTIEEKKKLIDIGMFLAEESRFWLTQTGVLVGALREISKIPNLPVEVVNAIHSTMKNHNAAVSVWNDGHPASKLSE
jgi:hypothetical protein